MWDYECISERDERERFRVTSMHLSKTVALNAIFDGAGQTVYLTPEQARAVAKSILVAADDVDTSLAEHRTHTGDE